LAKLPNADFDQIATMGFSFGGLSNVLSQMRNENIKAIVSLDGSIKYQYATLKKSAFFNIEKVDVPFIHMAQKDIPEQVLKEDKIDSTLNYKFEFYDNLLYSKAYSLKFHKLTHSYFSTLGVLFQQRDLRQDKSDLEIMKSYKLVSEYALNFLNAFVKNDANALNFMENEPSANGIQNGLITRQTKQSESKTFSFRDFNELASKQNYENLDELFESTLKKYPSMELPEGNLNILGLQLIFDPKTSEQGINILLLATSIYPNSANLFDSLAEAYLYVGNKEKAIENFDKSLELNSQNQNAIVRLKQLRK
jgi:tetratricopeptide (TPR) repeat protein